MMKKYCLTFSLVFLTPFIFSCATTNRAYEGPKRPVTEIAQISHDPGIEILRIDNYEAPKVVKNFIWEVPPGDHKIYVIYYTNQQKPVSSYTTETNVTKSDKGFILNLKSEPYGVYRIKNKILGTFLTYKV